MSMRKRQIYLILIDVWMLADFRLSFAQSQSFLPVQPFWWQQWSECGIHRMHSALVCLPPLHISLLSISNQINTAGLMGKTWKEGDKSILGAQKVSLPQIEMAREFSCAAPQHLALFVIQREQPRRNAWVRHSSFSYIVNRLVWLNMVASVATWFIHDNIPTTVGKCTTLSRLKMSHQPGNTAHQTRTEWEKCSGAGIRTLDLRLKLFAPSCHDGCDESKIERRSWAELAARRAIPIIHS